VRILKDFKCFSFGSKGETSEGEDDTEDRSGVLGTQSEAKGNRTRGEIRPPPSAKCPRCENDGGGREQRDSKVGHDNREMRGDGWIDGKRQESGESDDGTKDAAEREGKDEQKDSVEDPHRDASVMLKGVGIVFLAPDIAVSVGALVGLSWISRKGLRWKPKAEIIEPTQSLTSGGCSG